MSQFSNDLKQWADGISKTITFIVTKDCQLACKYCYLVGKNTTERMSWKVAKAAIDYILEHEDQFPEKSLSVVSHFLKLI